MKVVTKNAKGCRVQLTFKSEDYPKGKAYIFNNAMDKFDDTQLTTFVEAIAMLVDGNLDNSINVTSTTKVMVDEAA